MGREKRDVEGLAWVKAGTEERWKIVVGIAPNEFAVKEEWDCGSLVRVPWKDCGESRSC